MFDSYLIWWRESFFAGESIDEIIAGIEDNYRKNRFIAMWFMKSKEEFWTYYAMRKELKLERVFNTIIATIFYETEKKEWKQRLIDLLEITHDLQESEEVPLYEIKVLQKDMNSYEVYRRKKLGIPLYP
ncbi:hypothetical protein NYE70_22135 [Paenibacillus sp. FSL R5-0407]|uniref:hypothetical protein n=1 Tax=unclassified Paenibacillus TaxID=185978 RepID=UPI000B925FCB|nr:hypothetical protein [Paenibacillus sp. RUD330]ASS66987.1 hypothetical protein CIC07_13230 [Paenibacillus sp. RUD330]